MEALRGHFAKLKESIAVKRGSEKRSSAEVVGGLSDKELKEQLMVRGGQGMEGVQDRGEMMAMLLVK